MIYSAIIGVPILIGIMAQKGKGRTGALWGFITLVIIFVWFSIVLMSTISLREAPGYGDLIDEFVFALIVGAPVFVIMAIIVATLPNKNKPTTV